jgi:hypothetical protein
MQKCTYNCSSKTFFGKCLVVCTKFVIVFVCGGGLKVFLPYTLAGFDLMISNTFS